MWLVASLLTGCAEREVWTGRRCPRTEPDCLSEAPARDAAAVLDLDVDAASPPAMLHDAGDADACPDCSPEDAGDAALAARRLCPAGKYEGPLEGDYTPGAADACGLFPLFSGSGHGLLRFWIDEGGSMLASVGSHACDVGLTLGIDAGAEISLSGDGGASTSQGLILGSVDCATGRLQAEMRGIYRAVTLCTLGLIPDDFYTKGTLEAVFDPERGIFDGGVMRLSEPSSLLGFAPGGQFTFTAARVGPSDPLDPRDADCFAGKPFPDHLFDAGR